MAPKLIRCIKFSFSLTAGARFRWINNKSVPHSSSVFAWRWGKNTCAPRKVYRLSIGWNCHTTWSQGNLHHIRLHFLKLDRKFFCLQPSLARLYSAAASPSKHRRTGRGGEGGCSPPKFWATQIFLGSKREFGQSQFLKTFPCFFFITLKRQIFSILIWKNPEVSVIIQLHSLETLTVVA